MPRPTTFLWGTRNLQNNTPVSFHGGNARNTSLLAHFIILLPVAHKGCISTSMRANGSSDTERRGTMETELLLRTTAAGLRPPLLRAFWPELPPAMSGASEPASASTLFFVSTPVSPSASLNTLTSCANRGRVDGAVLQQRWIAVK